MYREFGHRIVAITDTNNRLEYLQETQLLLTNRATHLCKCNDVSDLISVIKIRLKK